LFLTFGLHSSAQNFQLKLLGSSKSEIKTLDSLDYTKKHKNLKSIADELTATSEKLSKMGYFENRILENAKENDSSYVAKFNLGEKINSIHMYISRKNLAPTHPHPNPLESKVGNKGEGVETEMDNTIIKYLIGLDKKKDTLIMPYGEIETFLSNTLQKLERKGFAFAKLKLINIKIIDRSLYADLQFESGQQRQLNSIVVQFAERDKKKNFPEGHLTQVNRKYRNSTFNQDIVRQIHTDFEKFRFVSQVKFPEILFTKDTTKVYVYLEKRKSNTFDGFIGFSNNETNKIRLNGYLDVILENTLKVGEQFSLYWKSDGNNQKTFKTGIELPYLFKSPLGLKAQIQIFKQDSIFQNTQTAIDLGYYIDYNTRIYLGYQATESSDIQNSNNKTVSDYKNSFFTSTVKYSKFDYDNSTFPEKSSLSSTVGIGKRITNDSPETIGTNKQFYIKLDVLHIFYLNPKNSLNINSRTNFLKSDTYVINELFRFGGSNSIRGFTENSLQANFMTALQTEYRYAVSPSLYIHSIIDYSYYQDDSSKNKGNLIGLGIGLGLSTKNGLLKLAFANGSFTNQEMKFYDTIVHLNYSIKF
jgi:hypothetical protein